MMSMPNTITFDDHDDGIWEFVGGRRVTKGNGQRWYEFTNQWAHNNSWVGHRWVNLTRILKCLEDFGSAAYWQSGDYVRDNLDQINAADPDEVRKLVANGGESMLRAAGDRGTAIHAAIEAIAAYEPVDWDNIDQHDAAGWMPAVERFFAENKLAFEVMERVAFDPLREVACTIDAVVRLNGVLTLVDWKTRSKTHDKRRKEAAQVSAGVMMARSGHILGTDGEPMSLEVEAGAVITFCPDTTYRIHWVDLEDGITLYSRAHALYTSDDGFGESSPELQPLDVNAVMRTRIDAIPDAHACKMELAVRWRDANLGKPSKDELELGDWTAADRLLRAAEANFGFGPEKPAPTRANADRVKTIDTEIDALAPDLRERFGQAAGPLLRRWTSGIPPTDDDADDMDRILGTLAEEHGQRISTVCSLVADFHYAFDTDFANTLLALLPEEWGAWTARDLRIADALLAAGRAGALEVEDRELVPAADAVKTLGSTGKRDRTTEARRFAEANHIAVPRKWDDVTSDVRLFAAVARAHQQQQQANQEQSP